MSDRKQQRRPKARFAAGCLVIAAACAALAAGCAKKQAETGPQPAQLVDAAEVRTRDVKKAIDCFGTLASPHSVEVKSRVAGQIEAVHFKEGDRVEKGAVLFTLDEREYRALLARAQAALNANMVALKRKQDTLARNRTLFEKNLVSTQDYENLLIDAQAAEAQVEADKAAVDLAVLNLEYCSITAPAAGVTGRRMVDPGNLVGAGSGPTLVSIRLTDPLLVDFTVSERHLAEVRAAAAAGEASVLVAPRGQTDSLREGTLALLDNTVDTATGTIALRGSIPNSDGAFWPGQFVDVRLVTGTIKAATIVPGGAVQIGKKGHYSYVIGADGKAQLRPLVLGPRDGDDLVVLAGLKPGEKVVTLGHLGLYPGASVQEKPRQDPAQPAASAQEPAR